MLYRPNITDDQARAEGLRREACLLGDDLAEAEVWFVDDTGRVRVVDNRAAGEVTIYAFDSPTRYNLVWQAEARNVPWPVLAGTIRGASGWALAQDAIAEAEIRRAEAAEAL